MRSEAAGRTPPAAPAGLRGQAEPLAARLPPLLVEADRLAATVAQGVHGRRRTGVGETFWQYRAFQPGDAASSIDWRQSARSDGLFVREQEWEAAASVWLWPDRSARMAWRSAAFLPSKADRAVVLAIALASLLLRAGERVALLGGASRPQTGRAGLGALVRDLETSEPGSGVPPQVRLPRHARLVLISDLLAGEEALRLRLAPLVEQGICGAILQIADPAEESLPFRGRVLFRDVAEAGERLIGRVEQVQDDYRAIWQAHRAAAADLARGLGWRHAFHSTEHPAEPALLALYGMLAPGSIG
jgi:uncharacterized protein (DUF58 family)